MVQRCSRCPRRRGPTTPPTRSPSPSATSTTPRCGRAVGVRGVIALVRGEVAVRRPDHVVVDCGGVGYRLAVSAQTLRARPGRSASRSPCTPT